MKIQHKILLILFIFLSSLSLLEADDKVTFINIEKVINNAKSGKLIIQKLEQINKEISSELKTKNDSIVSKEEKLLKQKNIISNEEFEKRIVDLKQEISEFNNYRKIKISEFEKLKKKEFDNYLKLISPIIQKYTSDNSISIVLNQKNIFIADKKYDITSDIILIVDKNLNQ